MTPVTSPQRAHALSLLLARYIAGQVADTQLNGVADLFEDSDADATERSAFARFYLDALSAEGEVALPKLDELEDLLAIARA